MTPKQLPLDLSHQAGLTREDLVVSASNQAAVTLIDSWPHWPASLMVLAGPAGAGKTHLATIWAKAAGAAVLRPEDIADAAAQSFGDVLIDGLGDERVDETALFHLINAVRQRQGSLLITSRRWPSQWPVALPDLISRIKSAPTVEIGEPDDALLSGVIMKLFADRQLAIEPSLISFLVKRIERSLMSVQTVVARLDRAALESKSRITQQMAGAVLSELDFGQKSFEL